MKKNSTFILRVLNLFIFFIIAIASTCIFVQSTSAQGLQVSPVNPRYFVDGSGKVVFLTGSHTWNNLQDLPDVDQTPTDPPPTMNYTAWLDKLSGYGHNFFRLWHWEQAKGMEAVTNNNIWITPHPYLRTGPGMALDGKPKWDLSKFNQDYFDRMRARIIEAGNRGMYVSIMLFNGFSTDDKGIGSGNPWLGHPMHSSNNINSINGDTNGDGYGTETHQNSIPIVTTIQEAYVKKVIDTVNDLDNVLYEICNECDAGSIQWQNNMIDYIHTYEATLAKQHPVGMTVAYPSGSNSALFASKADWISPNASDGYDSNPPASSGKKVIISDTDHLWGIGGNRSWAWKTFTRGMMPIFMDDNSTTSDFISLRLNLGYIRSYADKVDMISMVPSSTLASTGYCLASNYEYIVYAPSGGAFSVNLNKTPGILTVEWLNPSNGNIVNKGVVTGGSTRWFTPPFSGDAVLYLKSDGGPDTTPPTSPSHLVGNAVSPTQINLSWAGSTDNVGVMGYNVLRDGKQVGVSSSTSYEDKGLVPDTSYVYAISAYDASGNISPESPQVSIRTLPASSDTTPPIISDVKVSSVTSNSARITWKTNEPSDSQVEYRRSTTYGSITDLDPTLVTSHAVTINGLSPRTTYTFRVYSKDKYGNLSVSPYKSFTTRWVATNWWW